MVTSVPDRAHPQVRPWDDHRVTVTFRPGDPRDWCAVTCEPDALAHDWLLHMVDEAILRLMDWRYGFVQAAAQEAGRTPTAIPLTGLRLPREEGRP